MTVTVENYQGTHNRFDVRSLPSTLVAGHEFFTEAVEFYNDDPDVKETIDLYLVKLNEYLASHAEKVSNIKDSNKRNRGEQKAKRDAWKGKSRGQKREAAPPAPKVDRKALFQPKSRGKKPLFKAGKLKNLKPRTNPYAYDPDTQAYRELLPGMYEGNSYHAYQVTVGWCLLYDSGHAIAYEIKDLVKRDEGDIDKYEFDIFDARTGLSMGYGQSSELRQAQIDAVEIAEGELLVSGWAEKIKNHVNQHGLPPIFHDPNQAAIDFDKKLPSRKLKTAFRPKSRGSKAKFRKNELVYYSDSGLRHSIKEVERLPDEAVYIMENGDRRFAKELTRTKPKAAFKPKSRGKTAEPAPSSAKVIEDAVKEATAQGPPAAKPTIKPNPSISKKIAKKAEKAVNAVKAKKEKPASDATKVKAISPEVGYFKRYVNMNGKERTYDQVLKLLTDLQKTIQKGDIRKASPYSEDIFQIQKNLLKALNGSKSDTIRLVNNDKSLAKWVHIAGGEKVYESINLLRSYLNMQGKQATDDRLQTLLARAKKADLSDDPYQDRVKQMIRNLEKALDKKGPLEIEKVELSGLSGLLGHLQAGHTNAFKGRMTSEQLMNSRFENLPLTGKFKKLLGEPGIGATVMIHGTPGQGKTTFSLQLARDLAIHHGRVLYVSGEESGSVTLQDKLRRAGGATPKLVLDDHVPEDVHEFDFLFLDSVQSLHFKLDDMRQLRKDNPRMTIFFVMQSTKTGNFKGDRAWEHDLDAVIMVAGGEATTTKNRYKASESINIW